MLHPLDHPASVGIMVAIGRQEANQDLVEDNVVEHLDVTGAGQLVGEASCKSTAALDQVRDSLASECAERGIDGEPPSSSRMFWVVVQGIALTAGAWL